MEKSQVICADALQYLQDLPDHSVPNILTGLPDLDELSDDMTVDEYLLWYREVMDLLLSKISKSGYLILIQTDRKFRRQLLDKSLLSSVSAMGWGAKQISHKIALLRDIDKTNLFRPTYSHVLCYSYEGSTGIATPDVIPVSKLLYKNGSHPLAVRRGLEFIKKQNPKQLSVLDPFVGRGTTIKIGEELGFKVTGIDIDEEQCKYARKFIPD